jgi:hypothetical protein
MFGRKQREFLSATRLLLNRNRDGECLDLSERIATYNKTVTPDRDVECFDRIQKES